MTLIALRDFHFIDRDVLQGEEFEAAERIANALIASGRAMPKLDPTEATYPRKRSPIAARPSGAKVRPYSRTTPF